MAAKAGAFRAALIARGMAEALTGLGAAAVSTGAGMAASTAAGAAMSGIFEAAISRTGATVAGIRAGTTDGAVRGGGLSVASGIPTPRPSTPTPTHTSSTQSRYLRPRPYSIGTTAPTRQAIIPTFRAARRSGSRLRPSRHSYFVPLVDPDSQEGDGAGVNTEHNAQGDVFL